MRWWVSTRAISQLESLKLTRPSVSAWLPLKRCIASKKAVFLSVSVNQAQSNGAIQRVDAAGVPNGVGP